MMSQTDNIVGAKITVFFNVALQLTNTIYVRYLYSTNQSDYDTPRNNFFITPPWKPSSCET